MVHNYNTLTIGWTFPETCLFWDHLHLQFSPSWESFILLQCHYFNTLTSRNFAWLPTFLLLDKNQSFYLTLNSQYSCSNTHHHPVPNHLIEESIKITGPWDCLDVSEKLFKMLFSFIKLKLLIHISLRNAILFKCLQYFLFTFFIHI